MHQPSPINFERFIARRNRLAEQIPDNSLVVCSSGELKIRNNDCNYPFRVDSYFYYLTGFDEPRSVLLLDKNKHDDAEHVLLLQTSNPAMELWDGPCLGLDGAITVLGMDKAYSIDKINKILTKRLTGKKFIYMPLAIADDNYNFIQKSSNLSNDTKIKNLTELLDNMRLIKDEDEIRQIRYACLVSANAHIEVMKKRQQYQYEYQLAALFKYHCQLLACEFQAYSPIVAAGQAACILHYTSNSQPLKLGELLLIDAGCEYNYYAADITRTFPLGDKFTIPQQEIYTLVLSAQQAGIAIISPGRRWCEVQQIIVDILVTGLIALNILQGNKQDIIDSKIYQQFYPHSSGHWLGLDVHDVGAYKTTNDSQVFVPGMLLTVEPGLYFPPNCASIAAQWRGIGVRIEDDILVTQNGHEVLTSMLPKSIEAMLALSE